MQLTENFESIVTQDNEHFAIHNRKSNSVDGGYRFGEKADFEDKGIKYSVTVLPNEDGRTYKVNLQKR